MLVKQGMVSCDVGHISWKPLLALIETSDLHPIIRAHSQDRMLIDGQETSFGRHQQKYCHYVRKRNSSFLQISELALQSIPRLADNGNL